MPSNEKIVNYKEKQAECKHQILLSMPAKIKSSRKACSIAAVKKIQTDVMNLRFWNFIHHKRHILYFFQNDPNDFFKF